MYQFSLIIWNNFYQSNLPTNCRCQSTFLQFYANKWIITEVIHLNCWIKNFEKQKFQFFVKHDRQNDSHFELKVGFKTLNSFRVFSWLAKNEWFAKNEEQKMSDDHRNAASVHAFRRYRRDQPVEPTMLRLNPDRD